jgi:hypothetical protein
MQSLTLSPLGSPVSDVRPAFNIVTAYEDFETGRRAKKTYDYLDQHLSEQCVLSNQMWKFDVLAMPKLSEIAAREAAAADVVIIAAHGPDGFRHHVRFWIESWLEGAENLIALVGLFDSEYIENAARDYLARVADRASVAFFSQPAVSLASGNGGFSAMSDRNGQTFSVLASIPEGEQSSSHWGINE